MNKQIPKVQIGKRTVGIDYPPLILAEVGINHEGDYDKAIQLVDAAKESGAEAIKSQKYMRLKQLRPNM